MFIPTYNCENIIRGTLESVLMQTYPAIEVLCVDDGSEDATLDILKDYADKDSRVRCFSKKNQGGVPYSWNFIMPHIKGDFTFYMSHDDVMDRNLLEILVKELDKDEKVDLVIPSVVYFAKDMKNPESRFNQINIKYDVSGRSPLDGETAFDEMLDYSISGFGLWRTDVIRHIGMPQTSFNSDECMQRIWARHCRVVAFSAARFGYRQVNGSIVSGLKPYHFFSLDTNLRLFREMELSGFISKGRKGKITNKFYKSLYYLSRRFLERRDEFTELQRKELSRLIVSSYNAYRYNLANDISLRGWYYKLTAVLPCVFGLKRFKRLMDC